MWDTASPQAVTVILFIYFIHGFSVTVLSFKKTKLYNVQFMLVSKMPHRKNNNKTVGDKCCMTLFTFLCHKAVRFVYNILITSVVETFKFRFGFQYENEIVTVTHERKREREKEGEKEKVRV